MRQPTIVVPPRANPTTPYVPGKKTSSTPPISGAKTLPILLKKLFNENMVARYLGNCSKIRIANAGIAIAANQTCIISNIKASQMLGTKKKTPVKQAARNVVHTATGFAPSRLTSRPETNGAKTNNMIDVS